MTVDLEEGFLQKEAKTELTFLTHDILGSLQEIVLSVDKGIKVAPYPFHPLH